MTWQTIKIPDILDHNQAFSVRFSYHHLNFGPFEKRTHINHLNTRLVQDSDGYRNYNGGSNTKRVQYSKGGMRSEFEWCLVFEWLIKWRSFCQKKHSRSEKHGNFLGILNINGTCDQFNTAFMPKFVLQNAKKNYRNCQNGQQKHLN